MKTKFKFNQSKTLVFLLLMSIGVNAQEATTEATPKTDFPVNAGWNFLAEPYMMFPNMSGDVGIGNLPDVSFNADPSEILGNLHIGAMLYIEAVKGKWNVNTDLLYMNLSEGIDPSALVSTGEVSAKQLGWETAGLYSVRPCLQVGVGILLNSIESDVNINRNLIGGGTTNVSASLSETWFDAMIIASFINKPGAKFIYKVRGEIGGFGISGDSNFAWQVQGYAGYRFSELFQLSAGYRVIGLDYATGSGSDRFLYNVDTYGGVLRFGFNF
jgi:hypothetical protein